MRVGVFGLGRFGRFWATILREHFEVFVYNRSVRPAPEGTHPVEASRLADCDTIFLCNSISSMLEVADMLATILAPILRDHRRRPPLVADTCSVKVYPLSVLRDRLDPAIPILGTHPMFGPDSAGKGLRGLPLVICASGTDDPRVAAWVRHFESLGLRILEMSPEEHDEEAARTQGVTHFVGRVLDAFGLSESDMATVGYRALSEIVEQTCNDPRGLFLDLQRFNPYTREVRERLARAFREIFAEVEAAEETKGRS